MTSGCRNNSRLDDQNVWEWSCIQNFTSEGEEIRKYRRTRKFLPSTYMLCSARTKREEKTDPRTRPRWDSVLADVPCGKSILSPLWQRRLVAFHRDTLSNNWRRKKRSLWECSPLATGLAHLVVRSKHRQFRGPRTKIETSAFRVQVNFKLFPSVVDNADTSSENARRAKSVLKCERARFADLVPSKYKNRRME